MIDSGSFVHAIDASVELPTHMVHANKPTDKHTVAETACGGKLHKMGSVLVDCEVDDVNVRVEFDNMKVKTPILSVRKLIRDNHDVYFSRKGNYIHCLKTGKKISFFEFQVDHPNLFFLLPDFLFTVLEYVLLDIALLVQNTQLIIFVDELDTHVVSGLASHFIFENQIVHFLLQRVYDQIQFISFIDFLTNNAHFIFVSKLLLVQLASQ